MKVIEIKGKVTVSDCDNGYDAEVVVQDGTKMLYVHVGEVDGLMMYDVCSRSMMDYLTRDDSNEEDFNDGDIIEQFEDKESALASSLGKAFAIAESTFEALCADI